MTPRRLYSFANGSRAEVYADRIVTTFGDGQATVATMLTPDDQGFRNLTAELGYGEDQFQNMAEHEVLHSLLAEWAEEKRSGVLWSQAHWPEIWRREPGPKGQEEERRVWAMQKLLNGITPAREDVALLGVLPDVEKAIEDARNLLRPDGAAMTSKWATQ